MKENNWFVFASEDERVAKSALKDKIYNQVCFHAQQALELLQQIKEFVEAKI